MVSCHPEVAPVDTTLKNNPKKQPHCQPFPSLIPCCCAVASRAPNLGSKPTPSTNSLSLAAHSPHSSRERGNDALLCTFGNSLGISPSPKAYSREIYGCPRHADPTNQRGLVQIIPRRPSTSRVCRCATRVAMDAQAWFGGRTGLQRTQPSTCVHTWQHRAVCCSSIQRRATPFRRVPEHGVFSSI